MDREAVFGLSGQVALVTGAGGGIGREIAEVFGAAGAAVVATDLLAERAEETAERIREQGGRAAGLVCDVTHESHLETVIAEAVGLYGRLTILANNAGGGGPKPFEMPMAEFRAAYELNVFSLFRLCQLAAPHMAAAGGGAIVNISSMAGENTNVRMASYASSKAAVNHLTRNIAFDLGPRGIRVNCIAPGAVRTEALARVLTPEAEAGMLTRTPLGRLGEPADIARAALFLVSPAASWISGQILTVSGGGVQELG